MRTYEERMEEIRRRAEDLRKVRRQRRNLAAWVVTAAACLCLILWNPANGRNKQALPEGVGAAGAGETVYYSQSATSIAEIRVSGMGKEITILDPEKILHIVYQLWSFESKASGNGETPILTFGAICDIPEGLRGEFDREEILPESTPGNFGAWSQQTDNESTIKDEPEENPNMACTVRLVLENGDEVLFLLTGEGLKAGDTGHVISLAAEQRQLLLHLLGLE